MDTICADTNLWPFVIQVSLLLSYLPATFLLYDRLRQSKKSERAAFELNQFGGGYTHAREKAIDACSYKRQEFILPLIYIIVALVGLYAITHPVFICMGVWKGLLEEYYRFVGKTTLPEIPTDILIGRALFWCWLGAYVHGLDRTIRHYLAHDLTPDVYVYAAQRFSVAFIVGGMVAIGVGAGLGGLDGLTQASLSTRLPVVYTACFFVGMFPDRGIKWVSKTAARILGLENPEDIKPLAMIEGMNSWQQSRLDQEGIANVQNLATADLLFLVSRTPFDVGNIVDWVDQALLIENVGDEQYTVLHKAGLTRAYDLCRAITADLEATANVAQLSTDALKLIQLALEAEPNLELIRSFRAKMLGEEI